jgi:hypothetical protein
MGHRFPKNEVTNANSLGLAWADQPSELRSPLAARTSCFKPHHVPGGQCCASIGADRDHHGSVTLLIQIKRPFAHAGLVFAFATFCAEYIITWAETAGRTRMNCRCGV